MTKITSFDGDLSDEETIRAKLAEVEQKIARRERIRDRVEEDLDRLQRLRDGLLVIVGDKEPESDAARKARLEKREQQLEQWRAVHKRRSEEQLRLAGESIQAQVEDLVNTLGGPVAAADLLDHLPDGTKRETVNWALWRAASDGRIRRIAQGRYVSVNFRGAGEEVKAIEDGSGSTKKRS